MPKCQLFRNLAGRGRVAADATINTSGGRWASTAAGGAWVTFLSGIARIGLLLRYTLRGG
jgi:hypothetical protein